MSEYKNPRPTATTSAANPDALYDNAVTFDKLLNEPDNQTTYQGKELISWQKAIDSIDWSYVGKFADGVTFTKKTDFAIDANGTQWIYVGSDPFPKSVAGGAVPGEPDYQAVHVSSLQNLAGLTEPSDLDLVYARTTPQPPLLSSRDTRFQVINSKGSIQRGLSDAVPLDDPRNFFRGLPSQDSWGDEQNIGTGSASFGRNGASYAYLGMTLGHDTVTYGVASLSGGAGTATGNPDIPNDGATYGYCSFAYGKDSIAQGRISHAIGEQCDALSDYSNVQGRECKAGPADPSHPDYIASDGLYAIAYGRRAEAYGDSAVAFGTAVTAYNGAHVFGSGINTGSPLTNSVPNSAAFGRVVDVATVKLFAPDVPANGAFGMIGINTNTTPEDRIEAHVKAGDTVSYISDSTSATEITFRLGGKVAGANRGIFDIAYTHPNTGQPYGVTKLFQNEKQFAKISETGVLTLTKEVALTKTAPLSSTSPGVKGEIRSDASYIYVCTATDTWKRSALSSW